ncbi:MAG: twin-arginine translocase subunit TatC [Spirochaetaceae bacterium]|nr:twin-arginine translocase subunit TatC [Spirochaetaceae bacterium]MDE0229868.1 twin-arginine translocase subunit TatC [Spirochaetaceae bacterium]MDE0446652.1 twin-arginine translocase subunit TatC [Spirochaetaceae bacterium]
MTASPGTMPFLQHAAELRKRLLVSLLAALAAAIVCYTFYESVLAVLLRPLDAVPDVAAAAGGDAYLFINTIFEGFLVRVKVALIAGVVLSLPVHFYNVIRFIFPGLTLRERRAISGALAASFVLLLVGFLYSYYSVIPLSVRFLTSSGFTPPGVGLLLNFGRNVFFVFQFLLVFLLVFQIPILLVVLMMTGAVTRRALLRASRYAVVLIFALSAVVTPPDVVSQVSLAVPMVGMFFLSILVAKLFGFGAE